MGILNREISPDRAAAICAQLEQDRLDAFMAFEAAQDALGEASLAAIDGGPKERAAESDALQAAEKAAMKLRLKESTLKAGRAQYSSVLEKHEATSLKARWDATQGLVDQMVIVAKEIEKDLPAVAQKFNKLAKLSADAYGSAPAKDAHYAESYLSASRLTYCFRMQLRKLGMTWAIEQSVNGDESVLSLSQQVKSGGEWVMKFSDPAKSGLAKPV